MTPKDIAEIAEALNDRCRPRTHYAGCHLDPRHRDCLARRLLGEVEAGVRLRERVKGLVAEWRDEAIGMRKEAAAVGMNFMAVQASELEARASELESILEDRP